VKSTEYMVDTNVIIRYLLADHPEFFERSRVFMNEVKVGKIQALIPECVIAECVYILLKIYNIPRREIAEKLSGILKYRGVITPQREDLIQALLLFAQKNIDIVDAIVLVIGSKENRQPFSFDKDLKT